jgi:hypothetical protein
MWLLLKIFGLQINNNNYIRDDIKRVCTKELQKPGFFD